MKKYNKFLLIAGFGALSLTSCNLDLEPNNYIKGETTENLLTTKNVDYYLNGINASYRASFYGDLIYPAEVMCDGFNATNIYGNNYGAIHRSDADFTASNQNTIETWGQHYGSLKNFNIFINQIERFLQEYSSDANAVAKGKLYDGYAHFYRANAYLELVRHFAKAYDPATAATDEAVPLVLENDIEAKPARATVKAVYDQIKADLDIAAAEIATKRVEPMLGVTTANFKMTPTVSGVDALYARYYLDIQDYAKAAEYSKKVIDNPEFALASTQDAFEAEYTYDKGTEAIMQLAGNIQENGASTNYMFTRTQFNEGFVLSWNPKGYYYEPYYLPSQKLISLYTAGDLRFQNWFNQRAILYIGGATVGNAYLFTRYMGNPELTTSVPNSRHLVKPFLLPEMYLINAEANAKAGKTTDAVTILNQLQNARGAQTTGASIDEIGDEWFREMVGEGQRFLFLKRNHMGFNGRPAQPKAADKLVVTGENFTDKVLPADSKFFAWPIPAREIKVNSNLTQNPGY
ncbi:RagB/SusD family nutrient uptake outer membrane protein [Prevotella pallens]|mgnify:FL=1|uniref:RagB/SusD family nutrient uptake outer membrane protein n=1 Tax=Prevotella pallens TaxID=60133 RepID=UPI001CB1593D|nr:RagB/SusD family nutrient uptake outer membrane protein [Prevotella pallens]MBF1498394.1 RagB/SusD family nutrient uptake outer membrane protein [Prevotella pallens]